MEGLLSDHINLSPEEVFEVLLQGNAVNQAPPGLQLNKHVQIAIQPLVPPRHRPEKSKVEGSVLSGDA